ncbi:uncharacterized protein K444DRAFT_525247 [Hyaloscypha bicolor E]|uniref:ATPase AAA-type core domain-containing protein n=1 Tax=Hyaloscypha bicolor E TaxID=1095630 RepID=A0A2J6TGR1_9HELO|nr:uncharacterized protein K444DRAFT_525247 [Hyaloscypha bicolor E]PMD62191.1 hypothetical protein K444DRAFT_525247 [Hyaloscypha bicolor E]
MPGFMLFTKRWGLFHISGLMPVDYNEDAFAGLVLPPNTKKTFSSLIELQKEGSLEFDDMIAGNGEGLIILLQGPPGVGKAFTAESIGDFSKRPLYTLGKQDFGCSSLNSYKSLTAALARASKWNSIVLLDVAK